jgi:hypothetical protein
MNVTETLNLMLCRYVELQAQSEGAQVSVKIVDTRDFLIEEHFPEVFTRLAGGGHATQMQDIHEAVKIFEWNVNGYWVEFAHQEAWSLRGCPRVVGFSLWGGIRIA